MITDEERQSIINEAVEKALLALPDVISSLMMHHAELYKLNRTFYEQHPDFVSSKDIVSAVVEQIEGTNPGIDYSEILRRAVPIIKDQIKIVRNSDVKTLTKPKRDLSRLTLKGDHGEL